MSGRSSIILLVLAILASTKSAALPVEDLYVAEVLVASRDESELSQGARAGLLQVLVRVSGESNVEQNPPISSALRRPSDYYYQYGYESTDRTLVIDGEEVPAWILRIGFEPSAVSRLLRNAGLPVWGSNRPGVLVWIAVSDEEGRRILAETDAGPVVDALNRRARARGLPLLYPILDLEDGSALSSAEVWGLFVDRIEFASMRYNPDVILAGRIQRSMRGEWSGRWNYRIEDRWRSFDNAALQLDELMAGIIDRLADELADRYAVDSSRGSVFLRVEAVDDLQDYANLSAYLESLSPVVDSLVIEVDDDEILFRLQTEGQSEQLMETIELDDKMILINGGSGRSEQSPVHYRWLSD